MKEVKRLLAKYKSFILNNKITFLFVGLLAASLLVIIPLLNQNIKLKTQLNLYLDSPKPVDELETQKPIQEPKSDKWPTVEPLIVNNKLTSPLMNRDFIPQRIHWTLIDGWEFENYSFVWCELEGGGCEYQLIIKNVDNPEYKLEFRQQDSGVATCNFIRDDESAIGEYFVPEYQTLQTNFGSIRFGKSTNNNELLLCQNNVSRMSKKTTDWLVLTEVGWINLVTPNNPNEEIINQMIEIVQLVEEETFILK